MIRTGVSTAGTQVQSLVKERRSHKSHSVAKNKKNTVSIIYKIENNDESYFIAQQTNYIFNIL